MREAAGEISELRVDGTQHGMLAHDDFVGCKRNQGATGHGVVGHKDCDPGLVLANSLRDLQRRQYKTTRGVEDEVERYIGIRHLDGAQNLF